MFNLNIIELFSNDGYITTSKFLIKKIGLIEAVFLGELCSECQYWNKVNSEFDGWFRSSIANIEKQTGLKRKLQEKGHFGGYSDK